MAVAAGPRLRHQILMLLRVLPSVHPQLSRVTLARAPLTASAVALVATRFPKKREQSPRLIRYKPSHMLRACSTLLGTLALSLLPGAALATTSAELYTPTAYGYGRYEARVRFAAGDGVISSFFLWKDGSEQAGTFWNELDFEKVGADCHLETNPIFGNPSANHSQRHALDSKLCDSFHTYTYEWTREYIAWFVDSVEIRRETGATAQAYAENASGGMQMHFNVWPGDASFGGNFSPSSLPLHQYIDWVQFSKYANGAFTLDFREDFTGPGLPSNFTTGNWGSPKNLSTHDARNVNLIGGCAVLSLTADDATGPTGAVPCDDEAPGGGGSASGGSASGGSSSGGSSSGGNASGGGASGGTSVGASSSGGTATANANAGNAGVSASGGLAGTMPTVTGGTSAAAGTATNSPNSSSAPTSSSSSGGCSIGTNDAATPWLLALGVLAASALVRRSRAL